MKKVVITWKDERGMVLVVAMNAMPEEDAINLACHEYGVPRNSIIDVCEMTIRKSSPLSAYCV